MFNRLVSCKPGLGMARFNVGTCEPGPDLAESWEVSADGTVWIFRLRKGVHFQNLPPVNGREVTADDVKYSFDMYKKSPAESSLFDSVQKVEATDKYTVKVYLTGPNPDFIIETPAEVYIVIQPHEVADRDGDFKKTMVGTGPFQVKQIIGKDQIIYERNPGYFVPDAPLLDGLEYYVITDLATERAMYRAGQIQWTSSPSASRSEWESIMASNPNTAVQIFEWDWGSWVLYMRLDQAPFNDIRVRRAISLAIDRPGIIKDIFRGDGSVMNPLPWRFVSDAKPPLTQFPWYQYNPSKAKQLLADAGYPNGFSFTVDYYSYPQITPQLPVIQNDLKAIGVDLKGTVRDNTTATALLRNRSYKDSLVSYVITRTSANGFYYQPLYSKSSNNWAGVNDPSLDKILEASALEPDPAKRRDLFKKAFDMEADQVWRIPLVWPKQAYIMSSKLHNFVYTVNAIPIYKLAHAWDYLWLEQ